MKSAVSIVFLLCALVALSTAMRVRREEKYTTKYDNIDLDEILKSKRLLGNYVNCMKGAGKCTPDGAELKRVFPDALLSECSKCSEAQKKGADKVLRIIIEKYPEWFTELEAIYDKDGVYRSKFEVELKENGIILPPKA